jgi:hypothetical protein
MKIFGLLWIFILSMIFMSKMYAQCNTEQYTERCIKRIQPEGYTFLKTYPVTGEGGKQYSYIFSHGTKYMIALSNNDVNTKGFYLTIYDTNKKEISSSYVDGKYFSAVQFTCKSTGVYYMKFSFDGKNHCGVGVLGMKR